MKEKIKCQICEREFKSFQSLGNHLKTHKMKSKKYYDTYFKQENEGVCLECGKETRFKSIGQGYRRFCSNKCSTNSKEVQKKTKETWLKNYGVDNPSKSDIIKKQKEETCMKNHGVTNPLKSEEIREKSNQTYFERTGYKHPIKDPKIKKQKEETCMNNHGVSNPSKDPKIKKQKEETCMNNHGVSYPLQSKEVKTKMKETIKEKYDVDHYSQTKEFKEKLKQTCQEKYGCEYYLQSEDKQEKSKQTCQERYGVDHPMHNPEIFEKNQKSRFTSKQYTMPSGNTRLVQGYEHLALDFLVELYEESDIITKSTNVPKIKYIFEDKNRVYTPDIYIPSENLIIEVKSTYTYEVNLEKNLAKRQACLNQGYEFMFMIFDGKGNLI